MKLSSLSRAAYVLVALASAVAVPACGDSTSSSYTCCVNGSFYECPNEAAFNKCASDPSGCTRDASKDSTCTN